MKFWQSIVKESGLLFVALALGNFSNYLFQVVMIRMLTPADFGALTSVLSVAVVLMVPASTIQTVAAKYSATFKATNALPQAAYFYRRSYRKLAPYGLGLFALVIVAGPALAGFLRIQSLALFPILAAILLISLLSPVGRGFLQGFQKFNALGVNVVVDTIFRLGSALALVALGLGAAGALAGSLIGGLVGLLLALFVLRFLLSEPANPDGLDAKDVYSFARPTLAALLLFTVLISMDMVVVKHYFSPLQAGYYAGVVIMGKIVFFIPTALAMVLLPKTAEAHALEQESFGPLLRYLGLAALLSGGTTTAYFLFPKQILRLVAGANYLSSAPYIGWIGVAMTFFVLSYLLVNYQLSIHRFTFVYTLIGTVLLQGGLLYAFHENLGQVLTVLSACAAILLLANFGLAYHAGRIFRENFPPQAQSEGLQNEHSAYL